MAPRAVKTIYLFSGLGADQRVVQQLDLRGYNLVFIQWIAPENKETIQSYARRLSKQIETENPILIGISFGGMIACEIAAMMPVEKLILIASAKTRQELPVYYCIAGKCRLHRLLPADVMRRSGRIANWFFGAETKAEQQLLKAILNDTDTAFLKWAIDAIVRWKRVDSIPNTFHLHGTQDRIIPFRNIRSATAVRDGGHFMTVSKGAEVSEVLKEILI